MKKMIVETTGSFQLMGSQMDGSDRVGHSRPYVVQSTAYIHHKAAKGDVRILKQDLPLGADDKEWAAHFAECDGDVELAIESYLSTFPAVEAAEPNPAPDASKTEAKPGRGRRKNAE